MADFVKISDSLESPSSKTAASTVALSSIAESILDAAKNVTEGSDNSTDLREPLLADVYHEIGTWWISLDNSIPVGGLPHLGHLCARDTYGEFWPWCETNKTVVSDEEWLAYAESHNGCCPYYSYGDGSTTFRTPKYDQSFLKVLATIGGTGEMQEAGLPNITGSAANISWSNPGPISGAFYEGDIVSIPSAGSDVTSKKLLFDASRSDAVYGNSDTVTPQNFGIIVGVYAVGAVSAPIGETDAANLLNGISVLETGKASVDLSNLSMAGRSLAAGLGMPSSRYVDLTLGASGTEYMAPADGWFCIKLQATAADQWVSMQKAGIQLDSTVAYSGRYTGMIFPALKGSQVVVYYDDNMRTQHFRFFYAEGEEV